MKIVCASDLHRQESQVCWPKGDMLLLGGDYDIYKETELFVFNDWLGKLNYKHIVVIAGNHELFLPSYGRENIKKTLSNAIYLEHEYIELEGIKIFGSPWTPQFMNWAFMYPRCSKDANKLWKQIPKNLDILLTHGPAYQILDMNKAGDHCGCEVLQREVLKKKPKFHLTGHIHRPKKNSPYTITHNNTRFINIGLVNEDYDLKYKPTVIEI